MAEKKQESGFTVTDRRLFTEDGELRKDCLLYTSSACATHPPKSRLQKSSERGSQTRDYTRPMSPACPSAQCKGALCGSRFSNTLQSAYAIQDPGRPRSRYICPRTKLTEGRASA